MTATVATDYAPDSDLDQVAADAAELHHRLLANPHKLYGELIDMAVQHPAKLVQRLMCLIAWFDPRIPDRLLKRRAVETAQQAHT